MAQHPAKIDVPRYLSEKRLRKAERRRLREWRSTEERQASAEAVQAQFGRRSEIVRMLATGLPEQKLVHKGRLRFSLPANFSIIDNPERTLAAISDLAQQMRARKLGQVYLDFSKLTHYDLGANGLLDVLVEELSTEARQTGKKIRWRGNYPADADQRRFIRAMGVIKRLRIEHEYPPRAEEERLQLFDSRSKHYVRALRPQEVDRKSRVTQKFADHFNSCLQRVGRQLTDDGRSRLCIYVGEILDNAEQHGGVLDWSIQGYLDTQSAVRMCEIVIFNFGRSIAESFDRLNPASFALQQIQKYIDLHRRSGFFKQGWRREDLLTLIALQDKVSSKNATAADLRGYGTVDLIDFFQKVHAECSPGQSPGNTGARMAIVSGSTYVLFDGTYAMAPNREGTRIIAFNQENDLHRVPDDRFVRHLGGVSFPGTLISLKFPLPPSASTVVSAHED